VAQLERDRDLRGLVRVLEDASADGATKANAARALKNLICGNDSNTVAVFMAGTLPQLVELLSVGLDEGRAEAAGVLRNIAYDVDYTVSSSLRSFTKDYVCAGLRLLCYSYLFSFFFINIIKNGYESL
jgi:hypothetical protein